MNKRSSPDTKVKQHHTLVEFKAGYCLNVTCVQCENVKSISTIDSAQPTMAHDADTVTDSDLARPVIVTLRK